MPPRSVSSASHDCNTLSRLASSSSSYSPARATFVRISRVLSHSDHKVLARRTTDDVRDWPGSHITLYNRRTHSAASPSDNIRSLFSEAVALGCTLRNGQQVAQRTPDEINGVGSDTLDTPATSSCGVLGLKKKHTNRRSLVLCGVVRKSHIDERRTGQRKQK